MDGRVVVVVTGGRVVVVVVAGRAVVVVGRVVVVVRRIVVVVRRVRRRRDAVAPSATLGIASAATMISATALISIERRDRITPISIYRRGRGLISVPRGYGRNPMQQFDFRSRPRLRGQLHAVAAVLSVGALVWLVRSAATVEATVAAWIYGSAAILCYLTSSSYHIAARTERARAAMQRADRSMIYVMIAGTFTPVALLAVHGWSRWLLLSVVWVGALFGVALMLPKRPRLPRFGGALYIILGWAGVSVMPALADHPMRLVLMVTAGILYTLGAILFQLKRPQLHPAWFGFHEFWHVMGVAAGALLFVVNLSLISSPPS